MKKPSCMEVAAGGVTCMLLVVLASLASAGAKKFSDWSEPAALDAVNSPFVDSAPAISKDGLSLYLVSDRPDGHGGTDLLVSHRENLGSGFGPPVNLGQTVNSAAGEQSPALSRDGHWLFFQSNRPGGFGSQDIWASYRVDVHDDLAWQAPVNLGPVVNTTEFEGGPNFFENDEAGAPQLFFMRGPNAFNVGIHVSQMRPDGSWGPATPVTELNEGTRDAQPSIHHSGLRIYFDSDRAGLPNHIFVATRESVLDPWSPPVLVGAPITHPEGDLFPEIFRRGKIEQFFLVRDDTHDGNFEIFMSSRTRIGRGDDEEDDDDEGDDDDDDDDDDN